MQSRPSQSDHSLLRDPIVWAVIVVNGMVAVLSIFPVLNENTTYLLVEQYALVPISLLGMLAPWVALPPMESKREKIFWGLWSLSLFFHLVVRVIYLILPDVDYVVSGSLTVDLLYVLFYLPLVLSVILRPDRPRDEAEERGTLLLEFAGTAVYVLALIFYFLIIPRFFNQPEYETWVPSLLMYWVLDAFILVSLFYLRQTAATKEWRILFGWLALAPSCWVITDMVELTSYIGWDASAEWGKSPLDVLWYIPWIAITVGARVRTSPVPDFFGTGHRGPGETDLRELVTRPGWLLVSALVLPFVHILSNLLGLLDPSTRNLRELVVLVSLVLLLGMASLHQKILELRALALTRRSRELEERQKLLAAAVEQSPDAILIADGNGMVRYGNRALAALSGGLDGIIGAPLLSALPPGLEGEADGTLTGALVDSLAQGRAWEGRTDPDGDAGGREELVTVSPVRASDGSVGHWVLIRRDVTYLSQLERQFRQTQRLETVGALAGGIARDFNRLLGEIYGYGESLKAELSEDSRPWKDLLGLLTSTEKTADLVGQVLAFSQEGEEANRRLSVGVLMKETLSLVRSTLPPNVRISEQIEGVECPVMGISHQLGQVIRNVLSNAAQAMDPEGGKLEIELKAVEIDDAEAETLGLGGGGNFCLLSVRDTGRGMDDETLERAFEPFFTTKEMGRGTGLGLYLVRETVLAHGGAVRVKSAPHWGTLFQIFLPCVEGGGEIGDGLRGSLS